MGPTGRHRHATGHRRRHGEGVHEDHGEAHDRVDQRMGHVQQAMIDMRDHLLKLTQDPPAIGRDGLETTFKGLLESHLYSPR